MYTPFYSRIENLVRKIMLAHGIRTPDQLGVESVANKINVQVKRDLEFTFNRNRIIIIEKGKPWEEWPRFAHELCHYLEHCGNQLTMPKLFYQLQEYQADHFAHHFCVPTFMLDRIRLPPDRNGAIRLICANFTVGPEFAEKRLEKYENRHWQRAQSSNSPEHNPFIRNSLGKHMEIQRT